MPRKLIHVAFTLGVILCLLGVGILPAQKACAGVCCIRPGMHGCEHPPGAKGISHPAGCCCGGGACPCEVLQGCVSKLLVFSFFVVPSVENPVQSDITDGAVNLFPSRTFQSDLTNKTWTFGTGPPLELYLLNLSLLC